LPTNKIIKKYVELFLFIDKFLPDQLHPDVFEAAYRCAGQPLELSCARHAKNLRAA
jgi:hypothetical protein